MRLCLISSAALAALLAFARPSIAVVQNWDTYPDCGERTVVDLARLDLADISPQECWVIARVEPSKDSNRGFDANWVLDPRTRQPGEGPGGPRWFWIEDGSIDVLASLGPAPKDLHFKYDWSTFIGGVPGILEHDMTPFKYCPFRTAVEGGTVLCPVRDVPDGLSRYSPYYAMPAEWTNYIKPAWTFIRAHKEIFTPGPALAFSDQLKLLANDPNPLIATAAFRRLAQAGRLDTTLLDQSIKNSTGARRGILLYLALEYRDLNGRIAINSFVRKLVDTPAPLDEFKGTALGIYAGLDLPYRVDTETLHALRDQLSDPKYADDPLLRGVLHVLMGTPP